jgi:hypothetical protein
MIRAARLVAALALVWPTADLRAQPGHQRGDFGEETELYAETKQVNQFFRRFNAEENRDGERFYEGHPLYRDPEFRRAWLDLLFDAEGVRPGGPIDPADREAFIETLTAPGAPVFLDFHGGNWFAEVDCRFGYGGEDRPLTLFLRLEPDRLGHKWVIDQVRFRPYTDRFPPPREATSEFLHPLSHELDFMNLAKVFRATRDLAGYVPKDWTPDPLTLFLLDIAEGKLQFRTVTGQRFHFLQVDGWYFRLEDRQRPGYNTGWLIAELQRLPPGAREAKRQALYFGL